MADVEPDTELARRPMKVRSSRWAAALADWLGRQGWRPNTISILSFVFAATAGAGIVLAGSSAESFERGLLLIAAVFFIQLRLLCNLLDGMVAVEGGFKTKSGELFNELPDRFSDAVILASVGYFRVGDAVSHELGWLAAALAILVAYVRALGAASGAGQHYAGPMAKPQRMWVISAACMGEVIAGGVDTRASMPSGTILEIALILIIIGCLITVSRRILRIYHALERA